ncbi:D-alanyl-D-alanine carboxypeptidase [Microbacterium sp. A93]|uniref:D-alanyl-D-alanine carboxypeptidase family protein n=1 Tax=Microbacterium sp. A93 TaxID=3450716 RepID=UPI003F42580E
MTPDDATPDTGTLSRRALRARTGAVDAASPPALPPSDSPETVPDALEALLDTAETASDTPEPTPDAAETPDAPSAAATVFDFDADADLNVLERAVDETAPDAEWAGATHPVTALTWLDVDDVSEGTRPADLDAVTMRETGPDLLANASLRSGVLRTWMAPLGTVAVLAIAYSATMLLWPLNEVPPTVQAVEFQTVASEAATFSWPAGGSAGVSVAGVSSAASTLDSASIASLTKVVTSLMVLDEMPLQLGESGPEFAFTYGDTLDYWNYRRANQSALDVPVDGVLTEYQMLQGTLLGSANNYVDRLARELWGSDRQFAEAAERWLADRGLSGITVVTPSGFDEDNIATPEALLRLAERAMQNPVFAEIVGTASVEIPGAGLVENTNGMLADPGVVGIKTGTLVGWSLLTAKDITIGDTTVHLYASVLNQDDNDQRLEVTRSLFAGVEAALAATAPAVAEGTVVGTVSTPWGTSVDVVTDGDANVVLWNGVSASAEVDFDLSDQRADGDAIGTLTVTGPVNATDSSVSLADELEGPSPLWRLMHPLEILGLTEAG